MIILSLFTFIFILVIYFIYSNYINNKKSEKLKEDYKKQLEELEKRFQDIVRKDIIEEQKNKENNTQHNISIDWFIEHLPSSIKSIKDAQQFTDFLNEINNQMLIGEMQTYISNAETEEKRNLIIKIATLNKEYINFKNFSYKLFDDFINTNLDKLSDETLMKLKIWANDDVDNSIRISSSYLNFNTFIQHTIK